MSKDNFDEKNTDCDLATPESVFTQFRKTAIELQLSIDWQKLTTGAEAFDPRCSLVLKLSSLLVNLTRARPFYLDHRDFILVQRIFTQSAKEIVNQLIDLLERPCNAIESDKTYAAQLSARLSKCLVDIYRVFGMQFPWLSYCTPGSNVIKSHFSPSTPKPGRSIRRKRRGLYLHARSKRLSCCVSGDISWDEDSFSKACNAYDELNLLCDSLNGTDPVYETLLAESSFWETLGILNRGDLSLVAGVFCSLERRVPLGRIDRIVSIARSGVALGSFVALLLQDLEVPFSIASLYPYLRMEPLCHRNERILLVDGSINTGFTIRTVAQAMGPYLGRLRPEIIHYLVGLAPSDLDFPYFEPEFYDLSLKEKLTNLAFCNKDAFTRTDSEPYVKDEPWLKECGTIPDDSESNLISKYAAFIKNEFECKTPEDIPSPEDWFVELASDPKLKELLSGSVDVESGTDEEAKEARVFRVGGFFEKPRLIKEFTKSLYADFSTKKLIAEAVYDDTEALLVIFGARNVIPFGVALGLYEIANRDFEEGAAAPNKKLPRLYFALARKMGRCIPSHKILTSKRILIMDEALKDGLVLRTLADNLFERLEKSRNDKKRGLHSLQFGILVLTSSKEGCEKTQRHISSVVSRVNRSKKVGKVRSLWQHDSYVRVLAKPELLLPPK